MASREGRRRSFSCGAQPAAAILILFVVMSPAPASGDCFDHLIVSDDVVFGGVSDSIILVAEVNERTPQGTELYFIAVDEAVTRSLPTEEEFLKYFSVNSVDKFNLTFELRASLLGVPDYPDVQDEVFGKLSLSNFSDGSECTISISHMIKDQNSQTPMLDKESYSVTIREDYPPSLQLLDVEVTVWDYDGTEPNNMFSVIVSECPLKATEEKYNVIEGQPVRVYFELTSHLDFETSSTDTCTVTAKDYGVPSLISSQATIHIAVRDIPDEPPKFTSDFYFAEVTVSVPNGDPLATSPGPIHAEDGDKGILSTISYALEDGRPDAPGTDYFTIDTKNGSVTLTRELDAAILVFERISFLITAKDDTDDKGNAVLEVTLPPLPTTTASTTTVSTTEVTCPECTCPTEEPTTEGTCKPCPSPTTTAETCPSPTTAEPCPTTAEPCVCPTTAEPCPTTAEPCVCPTTAEPCPTTAEPCVCPTTGDITTPTEVIVTPCPTVTSPSITCPPCSTTTTTTLGPTPPSIAFRKDSYTGEIYPQFESVWQVKVDVGDGVNRDDVRFSWGKCKSNVREADKEKQQNVAQDGSGAETRVNLEVGLPWSTNLNGDLHFEQYKYATEVLKPLQEEVVLKVKAVTEESNTVNYTLREEDENFAIDAITGEITTKVEYVIPASYQLVAVATVTGTNLRAETQVTIVVLESSSGSLTMIKSLLRETVLEGNGVEEVVAVIQTSGPTGTMCISGVQPVAAAGMFRMDLVENEWRLKKVAALNYEDTREIQLKISAFEDKVPCTQTDTSDTELLRNEALVIISVKDMNDEEPKFVVPSGSSTLVAYPEDVALQKVAGPVITIQADDVDTVGLVRYSLDEASSGSFTVEEETGDVYPKGDFACRPSCDLSVMANDGKNEIEGKMKVNAQTSRRSEGQDDDGKKSVAFKVLVDTKEIEAENEGPSQKAAAANPTPRHLGGEQEETREWRPAYFRTEQKQYRGLRRTDPGEPEYYGTSSPEPPSAYVNVNPPTTSAPPSAAPSFSEPSSSGIYALPSTSSGASQPQPIYAQVVKPAKRDLPPTPAAAAAGPPKHIFRDPPPISEDVPRIGFSSIGTAQVDEPDADYEDGEAPKSSRFLALKGSPPPRKSSLARLQEDDAEDDSSNDGGSGIMYPGGKKSNLKQDDSEGQDDDGKKSVAFKVLVDTKEIEAENEGPSQKAAAAKSDALDILEANKKKLESGAFDDEDDDDDDDDDENNVKL
ncbi:uncharacterized protein [Panulirus ornatus]|uniref:uncharacterized protein n=1 Tax=Panulirus ornatus TaxID=150431 RepID=UPI003A84A4EA